MRGHTLPVSATAISRCPFIACHLGEGLILIGSIWNVWCRLQLECSVSSESPSVVARFLCPRHTSRIGGCVNDFRVHCCHMVGWRCLLLAKGYERKFVCSEHVTEELYLDAVFNLPSRGQLEQNGKWFCPATKGRERKRSGLKALCAPRNGLQPRKEKFTRASSAVEESGIKATNLNFMFTRAICNRRLFSLYSETPFFSLIHSYINLLFQTATSRACIISSNVSTDVKSLFFFSLSPLD